MWEEDSNELYFTQIEDSFIKNHKNENEMLRINWLKTPEDIYTPSGHCSQGSVFYRNIGKRLAYQLVAA
jgi:hypothetical protein